MNYTHAYSTFAVRCCLNPEQPNNYGSLAPIKVTAPKGSIVNCKYPSPVNARHVVGMFVPMPILKALHQVMPDRVLAEGSGRGVDRADPGQERRRVAVHLLDVQLFRRYGRAPDQERTFGHLLSDRRRRSAGRDPGGVDADRLQQEGAASGLWRYRGVSRRRRPDDRLPHAHQQSVAAQRGHEPHEAAPEGLGGGAPGAAGRFLVNGKTVSEARKMVMQPNDEVTLETPGGGGYGQPPL